jgi:hypothetical protein
MPVPHEQHGETTTTFACMFFLLVMIALKDYCPVKDFECESEYVQLCEFRLQMDIKFKKRLQMDSYVRQYLLLFKKFAHYQSVLQYKFIASHYNTRAQTVMIKKYFKNILPVATQRHNTSYRKKLGTKHGLRQPPSL